MFNVLLSFENNKTLKPILRNIYLTYGVDGFEVKIVYLKGIQLAGITYRKGVLFLGS